MGVSTISVSLFKKMVMNGAINLKNNQKEIDELNVFPVPDGDTGTNMSMTVMSGVREMNACESSSIVEVAKHLSRGALMGARGNSGVILSQFFRGLFVGLKDNTANDLTIEDLSIDNINLNFTTGDIYLININCNNLNMVWLFNL